MIAVKEGSEYEVGFEISRITRMLQNIQIELDNPEIDAKAIQSKVATALNTLNKVHDWMAEG